MITPYCYFHEPKLCFLMLILLLVFRDDYTPLHRSAIAGRLEVCRLLVASKADIAARNRCRSPLRACHGLLTPVAAAAKLPSNSPSTGTRPTLLHILAVSARHPTARLWQRLCSPTPAGTPPRRKLRRIQHRLKRYVCVSLLCRVLNQVSPQAVPRVAYL